MAIKITFFAFLFLVNGLNAQVNLVPNFSFEQYDICPTAADQIEYSTGWSTFSADISTPDYYNTCSGVGAMGIPKSAGCYQNERRNCNAYSGIVTWGASGNDREYIGHQLSEPLVIGQKYFISFYAVLDGLYYGTDWYGMPSNNIGMRLSTVPYDVNNPVPIDNFAHLFSSSVITDSVEWTLVTGTIIADSAYNFLILGNFFDDLNTDTNNYNCIQCFNTLSYYLVDDACISTDSLICNGGITLLPCNVSISEVSANQEISIYPIPASDLIFISFPKEESGIIQLFDAYGTLIYDQTIIQENDSQIDLSVYPSGIYYLKIEGNNGSNLPTQKIIKI